MKTYLIKILTVGCFLIVWASAATAQQVAAWKAPVSANQIKNPLAIPSKVDIKSRQLYDQQCGICHGVKGKGDGIASVALTPKPADFSKLLFTEQSDGAIYWKITTGRAPMAAYKGLLTDSEIWGLINYMRTFAKSSKK